MSKRINYQEFAAEYRSSGLSRKAFGAQRGMSSQMVSYYLKRAKEMKGKEELSQFRPLEIIQMPKEECPVIKITTARGVCVEIPIVNSL